MRFIKETIRECDSTSLLKAELLVSEHLLRSCVKMLSLPEQGSYQVGLYELSGKISSAQDKIKAINTRLSELKTK